MRFFIKFGSYFFGSGVVGTAVFQMTLYKRYCYASWDKWDNNWDGMKGLSASGTRNILLIRHGEYNTKGVTDADRMLTNRGEAQAEALGRCLKELSENLQLPIAKVVSSDLTRAVRTCRIAMTQIPNAPEPTFTHHIAEGPPHSFDPPQPGYRPTLENIQETQQRLNVFFTGHIKRPYSNGNTMELYFCHGNVIRYYLCKVLQLPLNAWLRFDLRHCSITWIVIRGDGRVACQCFGDVGYLPGNLLTRK